MRLNYQDVKAILAGIALPDWYRNIRWGVEALPFPPGGRWPPVRFRIEYDEPDVETGQMETQRARWWYVEPDFDEERVVKAAWLALRISDEHRQREAFTYKGRRPMDPHRSIIEG